MNADKLAYFFDHTDLSTVFKDWPEEIGLVLCVDEEGSCDLLLFHPEERQKIMYDISTVLNRPLGKFAVVPPIDGYPTRKVLFSDEQKLLKLVSRE